MSQRINKVVYAALINKSKKEILSTDETASGDSLHLFTVKSGTLSYNHTTNTKISGKLEIAVSTEDEDNFQFTRKLIGSYVRLYTTKAGGKGKKLIGTYIPSVKDIENQEGMVYNGSVELKSTLAALTENQLRRTSLKKGVNLYKKFQQYAANYGCMGLRTVRTNISARKKKLTLSKNKIFKAGSTPYDVMNYIAKKLNAYITVTNTGLIYLKAKGNNAIKYRFCDSPDNKYGWVYSLTSSIQITDNGTPKNRVIAYYEVTENKVTHRYYSKPVVLGSSNMHSKKNIGRIITSVAKVSKEDLKNKGANLNSTTSIRAKLTAIAKDELKELAEQNYTYTFSVPYVDGLTLNDKVEVVIGTDTYVVRVQAIEMDLFNGCEMKITGISSKAPKVYLDRKTKKL